MLHGPVRVRALLSGIWKPVAVIGGIFGVCVIGFVLTQGVSPFQGVYWGVITVSTVGYGDVVPTNPLSKIFAIILAGSTLGILGYLISQINTLAIRTREEELLGLNGTKFRGHVLLLGWTATARAALQELLLAGRRVAIMTRQQEFLAEIRTFVAHFLAEARRDPLLAARVSRDEDVFLALGDYAQGAALRLLNLSDAAEAIVASDDDGRNVLTALLLKQLAPGLRVVVAVLREELRETLHAAGVTYVISPSDLGGRMVAAAAIEPEIAQTFDDLTTSSYHYGMEEYPLRPPNPLVGLDFDTASRRLRESTGAILVGVAQPDPSRTGDDPGFRAILAPPPDTVLTPGGYALLLAAEIDRPRRDRWLGVPPGRPVKPTSGRSGTPESASTGPDSASSP